ncbi:MAG: SDR family NAD(P)-dependent oxidoreductase, partial [Alphaproteobacteria bacterium]
MTLPQTPSFSLSGKRALVAGASSGIGLACAAALSQAGAHVTVAARRVDKLSEVVDDLKANGASAEALALDISDTEATQAAIDQAEPFDVLVNSAGLAHHGPALDTIPHKFDEVVAINLKGAFFLTRAVAAKLMDAGKSGSLINISSQMAYVGGIERSVYCATKHAVEGFTKAVAIEWGPKGIRVNTICPTFIKTALT